MKIGISAAITVLFLSFLTNNGCEKKDHDNCDGLPPDSCQVDTCVGDTCQPDTACDVPTGEWQFLGVVGLDNEERIGSIAVHPFDSRIIYVGSMYDFSYGIDGKLFRSTNCGQTWDTLMTGLRTFTEIHFDPQNSNIVYAVNHLSIYKSSDAGQTWYPINDGMILDWETYVSRLAIDPKNSQVLYAGGTGFFGGDLYKSVDGGLHWLSASYAGDTLRNGVISIAIDPNNSNIIYAGTAGISEFLKSTDAGNTWHLLDLGEGPNCILIDPDNSNTIYIGRRNGIGIMKSMNAGQSWVFMNEGLPGISVEKIVKSNTNELYSSSDAGEIYKRKLGVDTSWSKFVTQGVEPPGYDSTGLLLNKYLFYKGVNGLYRIRLW